jgi:hypothetical protein
MIAKNVTIEQLKQALKITNQQFDNNIVFKRLEQTGKRVNFTLTVKSSKGAGARRGMNGRRIAAACYHFHGRLFENLLTLNQNAIVVSCKSTINKNGGNWCDSNIGSIMQPIMHSEACDCGA